MSSSYQKLKQENNLLKIQIAVLRNELGTSTLWMIDESQIPNNMTLEEFISEYHKNSGKILYTPKKIHAAKPYKPGIIRDQGLVH